MSQANDVHIMRRARAPIFMPTELREKMEAAIERMLAALDEFDAPDEDLEHGADDEAEEDEPSLGAFENINQGSTWLTADDGIDTELEDCDDEEGHDAEQVNEDGDVLDAGEQDDSDKEPSLGTLEIIDQRKAALTVEGASRTYLDCELGVFAAPKDMPRPQLYDGPQTLAQRELNKIRRARGLRERPLTYDGVRVVGYTTD